MSVYIAVRKKVHIVTGFLPLPDRSKLSMHISESEISETTLSVLSGSLMLFTEYT